MNYMEVCQEMGLKLNQPFIVDNEIGEQLYKFGSNCLLTGYKDQQGNLKWAYAYNQLDYVLKCKDSIVKDSSLIANWISPKVSNKGRHKGEQPFKARKKAPNYKIVTIRFREEEYKSLYDEILKQHGEDYASLTDYIKSLIKKDLGKEGVNEWIKIL